MRKTILLAVTTAILAACGTQPTPRTQAPDLTTLNGSPAVAGEILVKYKGGVTLSSLQPLRGSQQVSAFGDSHWGQLARVQVPKGQELSFAEAYSHQAGVEYAEPNYWVESPREEVQAVSLPKTSAPRLQALPSPITDKYFVEVPAGDPFATTSVGPAAPATPVIYSNVPYLWGIHRTRAPQAWAAGYTGQGVTVAVIDEGVDLTHEDLAANIWTNPDPTNPSCPGQHGYDFVDDDADPSDTGGHGTHVAGTIAAAANGKGVVGQAPEAKIAAVRALGYFGGSNYMLVRALKYAADCGFKVANNSWGSGAKSKAFYDVISYGTQKGTVYVFSAGNSFREGNRLSWPVGYSPVIPGLIGVGATSANNLRAGFSDAGDYVTVAAPGQGILSTIPTVQNPGDPYAYLQGTSMAAPQVSGVVALLFSAKPNLTPLQVRVALEQSANAVLTGQLAKPDYRTQNAGWYGYGLVDAKAALDYVLANY
ncbi:S8 family peptidase [Allomeiothermus silvanus]|uniref:S8 family peptidase n=1 Tax=Allomeiothermus silvanus TaxID=52022 RepID=UPI0023F0762C|nr:S8 family serine peptidase [Allomeiothermus silvanus]